MKQFTQLYALVFAASMAIVRPVVADAKIWPTDSICEDFDYMIKCLVETHPDPFSAWGGENSFYACADKFRESLLADSIGTEEELASRLGVFLSHLHDGHTYINQQFNGNSLRFLPVKFRQTADGLIVRETTEPYANLLGMKLEKVENAPISELRRRISEFVTVENESGEMLALRYYLNTEPYLRKLFPAFSGDSFKIELSDGNDTNQTIELPLVGQNELTSTPYKSISSLLNLPQRNFEYCFLDGSANTAYLRFNSVMSRDNIEYMRANGMDYEEAIRSIYQMQNIKMPESLDSAVQGLPAVAEVFHDLLMEMKNKRSKNLIVDLRNNGGGWTPIVYPMLYQIFGKDMINVANDTKYVTRLSSLYLKKYNTSIDAYNQANGNDWKLGDLVVQEDSEIMPPSNDDDLRKIVGEMMTSRPDILIQQHGEPLYKPENIYVITDGGTFSAAFHTAFGLWKLGAKIVGVASSQAPNTFMEVTEFQLPHTGLSASISNSAQMLLPADHKFAHQLEPDLRLDTETLRKYHNDPNAEILMILDL